MTETEMHTLCVVLKRDMPEYYDRLRLKLNSKKTMILDCIEIASHSDSVDYQNEINKVYHKSHSRLNEIEIILLNFVCLIKHKEHLNNEIVKDDAEIQRWLKVLQKYRAIATESDFQTSVNGLLDREARKLIKRYKISNKVGRPVGKGKQVFLYNGKEYRTIQECADDHGISKQGMHKRLKKLQII